MSNFDRATMEHRECKRGFCKLQGFSIRFFFLLWLNKRPTIGNTSWKLASFGTKTKPFCQKELVFPTGFTFLPWKRSWIWSPRWGHNGERLFPCCNNNITRSRKAKFSDKMNIISYAVISFF